MYVLNIRQLFVTTVILGLIGGGAMVVRADQVPSIAAGEDAVGTQSISLSQESLAQDVKISVDKEESSCPISLGLSYALYTDYVFRGVNFSEPAGEGREKLNHQLTVSLDWDTGKWGTFGFDTWFEWYAGQKMIDPDRGGQNLQEVDYTIRWTYPLEFIATDLTLGYTFYVFPNLAHTLRQDRAKGNNNDDRTHEYWFSLEHNDAWMWKGLFPENTDGVLNPSFLFAHDVGSILGVWMEFGLSHGFEVPGIEHLTVTPVWTVAAQCDYWKRGFFLVGDTWSLTVEYDLAGALKLPKWVGSLTLAGELYYFNAWGNFRGPDTGDEFWGGMTVNWGLGG
ncbi:MAG: hypothetical protein GXY44_07805 [Phycisphaerales bacterium]|nr:hypothetical protein [Phycisphaerales bacterium]